MKLVAIGCSWGGLSALTELFAALPDELDAAVVVTQHRLPEASQLEQLLRSRSKLPVREVEDKDEIERGRIFLAPPGYHLLVERSRAATAAGAPAGRFALSTDEPVHYARPSLDVLFESAADAYGPDCVGVVLTGAGADGAAGLLRICELDGTAIVQEPDSAERSEMPAAALLAVPSARILPLAAIPAALVELCSTRFAG